MVTKPRAKKKKKKNKGRKKQQKTLRDKIWLKSEADMQLKDMELTQNYSKAR